VTRPDAAERLAVLVHEVRSPTAALTAIATALDDRDLDRPARVEFVRLAVGACLAIERIMLDASYESVDLRELDPGRLAREVAARAALAGVTLETRIASNLPRVQGDDLRLRQALGNLVTNAYVHSGTDEPVEVGARAEAGEVVLYVSDSGVGVPDAERERILERGVRLDPSRPGTGLGLAIAKVVAEAHGGRLEVVSAPGEGATFAIVLPAR
jgi:signal transduction histidine kinase